jgi:hypothetical protein
MAAVSTTVPIKWLRERVNQIQRDILDFASTVCSPTSSNYESSASSSSPPLCSTPSGAGVNIPQTPTSGVGSVVKGTLFPTPGTPKMRNVSCARAGTRPGQDSLMRVLSAPSSREFYVPVPVISTALPERFTYDSAGRVLYCPRSTLSELYKRLRSATDDLFGKPYSINVMGFIGAGKSHILLALAVYLMAQRLQGDEDIPPVIYFSCYELVHESLITQTKEAITLAYPDDVVGIAKISTWEDAKRYIVARSVEQKRPVFILDGWNAVLDSNGMTLEDKSGLKGMIATSTKVFGISVNCDSMKVRSGSAFSRHFVVKGLSEAEWRGWRSSPGFAGLVSSFGNGNGREERFIVMTGLIPLLIFDLSNNIWDRIARKADRDEENAASDDLEGDANMEEENSAREDAGEAARATEQDAEQDNKEENLVDSDAAVQWCLTNPGHVVMHGRWIARKLRDFYVSLSDEEKASHVQLMAMSIGHQNANGRDSDINTALYDNRFFYEEVREGDAVLIPSCGIVAVKIVGILKDLASYNLEKQFSASWASRALSNQTNPSVRGFAFELYSIVFLRTNFYFEFCKLMRMRVTSSSSPSATAPKAPVINEVRFAGNYPEQSCIKYEPSCTCYVPMRWNLRYVDCVFRWVTTRTVLIAAPATPAQEAENEAEKSEGTAEGQAAGGVSSKRKASKSPQTKSPQKKKPVPVVQRVVYLVFAQVSLNDPANHAGTLKVFTAQHSGGTDCSRYRHVNDIDDEVEEVVMWVLPSTATIGILPESPHTQLLLKVPIDAARMSSPGSLG